MEMLGHRYNITAGLGALAAGTILSIPFGFGIALLPVLGYAAGTSIVALFVPGSRKFRDIVDKRKRDEARNATRQQLITEILNRVGDQHNLWSVYRRMCERRDSLKKIAEQRENALGEEDVDRLDDATVDFLGLWLGRIAISERSRAFGENELIRRIKAIESEIERCEDEADKRRLMKARSDLETLRKRRQEMGTRDAAAEAQMMTMADTFDEVYQRVMANPTSPEGLATELDGAVERMNVEEELDYILQDEVSAMLEPPKKQRA